jgi:hypothetical protein
MITDLVDFLRARLEEDLQVARAADAADFTAWLTAFTAALSATDEPEEVRRAIGHHIEHFTPARMIREVETKLRILSELDGVVSDTDVGDVKSKMVNASLRSVLKSLALPYAWHRDYRHQWRP